MARASMTLHQHEDGSTTVTLAVPSSAWWYLRGRVAAACLALAVWCLGGRAVLEDVEHA